MDAAVDSMPRPAGADLHHMAIQGQPLRGELTPMDAAMDSKPLPAGARSQECNSALEKALAAMAKEQNRGSKSGETPEALEPGMDYEGDRCHEGHDRPHDGGQRPPHEEGRCHEGLYGLAQGPDLSQCMSPAVYAAFLRNRRLKGPA